MHACRSVQPQPYRSWEKCGHGPVWWCAGALLSSCNTSNRASEWTPVGVPSMCALARQASVHRCHHERGAWAPSMGVSRQFQEHAIILHTTWRLLAAAEAYSIMCTTVTWRVATAQGLPGARPGEAWGLALVHCTPLRWCWGSHPPVAACGRRVALGARCMACCVVAEASQGPALCSWQARACQDCVNRAGEAGISGGEPGTHGVEGVDRVTECQVLTGWPHPTTVAGGSAAW